MSKIKIIHHGKTVLLTEEEFELLKDGFMQGTDPQARFRQMCIIDGVWDKALLEKVRMKVREF